LKVNQDYYNLVSNLLPGTQVIWGTNIAGNDTDNAYLIARAIMNAFFTPESQAQNISLAFLELGNECVAVAGPPVLFLTVRIQG
jgi:hypothetical protein